MIYDPYPLPDSCEHCDTGPLTIDEYVDHQLDRHNAGQVRTS